MATDYRIPVLENFEWQPAVLDRITQAALEAINKFEGPAKGTRFRIKALPKTPNNSNIPVIYVFVSFKFLSS